MTNDTSYREKGRAVFLAAIMVLSMVAMSAAFAGGVAAQGTTVDKTNLDGQTFFGQEVEIDNLNSTDDTVQLRSGTPDGENSLQTNLNIGDDNNVTIDTASLENGQYYIYDEGGATGVFEVLTQEIEFEFASDSVSAGSSATLNFADDNRAETVNVTVDAGGDLSASDLQDMFQDTEETSESNEARLINVTVGESLTPDFSGVAAGNYSFNFEVDDTGASDTANITVEEEDAKDGEFNQGTYNQEVGDVVDFGFTTTDVDDAYVQVEDEHGVFNATLDVDPAEGGSANLSMNSFLAEYDGNATQNGSEAVFSSEDDSVSVVADQISDDLNQPLKPSRVNIRLYDGNPTAGNADQLDRGIIRLQERSLDSAATYSAPGGLTASEITPSDLVDRNETTNGDYVVTEIQGSGIYGYLLDGSDNFNASNGLSLTINDTASPTYGSAGSLTVDGSEGYVTIDEDAENDTFYVIVEPQAISASGGDDPDFGDTWETTFTVGTDNPYITSDEGESVSSTFDYTERTMEFDHSQNDNDAYEVAGGQSATLSGTSSLLPGTEVSVSSFFETEILDGSTEVGEDGSWSAEMDLSDYESGNTFSIEASESGGTLTSNADTGEQSAVITEADGTTGSSFTVEASADGPVEVNGSAALEYTISNDGDEAGTTNYTVMVGGEEVANGTADLEPGNSTETMAYEDFDTSSAGDISWEVTTDDDDASGALTVEEAGDDTGGDDTTGDDGTGDGDGDGDSDDGDSDGGQPGFGLIVALFALIGAALLALRRQN